MLGTRPKEVQSKSFLLTFQTIEVVHVDIVNSHEDLKRRPKLLKIIWFTSENWESIFLACWAHNL